MKKNDFVYVGLAADILHEGHINIIRLASSYGKVIVGLLTDEAIASYKKFPYLNYKQRYLVVKNIKYVHDVIPQKTLDYITNLKLIRPKYVVHGDDWRTGIQKKVRQNVIKTLKKWSGRLIEPKYTKNISSTIIKKKFLELGNTPENRKVKLKRLINAKPLVRIIESHSPLTGLVIENLNFVSKGQFLEFDGMWSSSLTDSLLRAKPDTQSVDYSTRISGIAEMLDATTKPIIFDGDNGGRIEHLHFLIKSLERLGVSAVILEDKVGLKKNSLFKDQFGVKQDSIINFCKKIQKATKSKISDDFMVIARIESLILGKSVNDALKRAESYSKAGADAILIHSKDKNPNSVFKFSKKFRKSKYFKPLVAVPSTYSRTKEKDLVKNGFQVVIYANHLLRASYPAMLMTAKSILENKRSFDIEKKLTPIKKIIDLIK